MNDWNYFSIIYHDLEFREDHIFVKMNAQDGIRFICFLNQLKEGELFIVYSLLECHA